MSILLQLLLFGDNVYSNNQKEMLK
ncbi:hypothetical protein PHYNN_96 [Pantoea phage Phynn]|nr:hypothetical protein PHYNN_96 [Pantoea phage Phynn]